MPCGRTNLNYTVSSTQVLSLKGSNRTLNGVTPWPVGSNKVPHMKASPEIQSPSYFTSQAFILHKLSKVVSVPN
jgi:hypothetical protein